MVKILITFHADVNAVDGHGRTPLFWAAFEGHEQILVLLMENGAEPNQRTDDNCTPLYIAAERGTPLCIALFEIIIFLLWLTTKRSKKCFR